MLVAKRMTPNPITIKPDVPITEAMEWMRRVTHQIPQQGSHLVRGAVSLSAAPRPLSGGPGSGVSGGEVHHPEEKRRGEGFRGQRWLD